MGGRERFSPTDVSAHHPLTEKYEVAEMMDTRLCVVA